jgi:hypothetical protein
MLRCLLIITKNLNLFLYYYNKILSYEGVYPFKFQYASKKINKKFQYGPTLLPIQYFLEFMNAYEAPILVLACIFDRH